MNVLVLSLALLICGYCGANPHHSLTYVIQQVILDTDVNPHDGMISGDELIYELIAKWSTNPHATEPQVSKNDFLHEWTSRYGDNHADASTFFDNLDSNKDGVLKENDLTLHVLFGRLFVNLQGEVAVAEFEAFIRQMHPCGKHGHLGC